MALFDFLEITDTYEQRKVDRFEDDNGLVVDTVAVIDSSRPYETAVRHPKYNNRAWIVIEEYNTKEAAHT